MIKDMGFYIIGIIALYLFILILIDILKERRFKKNKKLVEDLIKQYDEDTYIHELILRATNDFKQLDLEEQSERFKNS